jgi:hypothetical protein
MIDTIGTTVPVQQGNRLHWDYAGGEVTEQRWEGVQAGIDNLYTFYKAYAGYMPTLDSLDLDQGRGKAILIARSVGNGEVNYELYGNDIYKSVETAKYFAIDAPVLTASQIMAVRQAITDQKSEAATGFAGKQLELWKLQAQGTDQYYETSYVLRETKNASKRSTLTASFLNVNRVESPPDTSAVNTLIGALPTGEWIKKAPQVRLIGLKRWQITTEWWWANKWSAILYGGTGTP